MNTVRHARLLVLPFLLWALQPFALAPEHRPHDIVPDLGAQIAEQGNQALLQIRAEARPALALPALPRAAR